MRLRLFHAADGTRVAYREAGVGPGLVMLHSAGMTHREFEPVVGAGMVVAPREAERDQGAIEQVAGIVSSEGSAGPVGAAQPRPAAAPRCLAPRIAALSAVVTAGRRIAATVAAA